MNLESYLDKLFNGSPKEYTVRRGNVAYLDASPLKKPFDMPAGQRFLALVFVVAAAIIGFIFINNTIIASARSAELDAKSLEENIARTQSITTVPNMVSLATLSDEEIWSQFEGQGYRLYDVSERSGSSNMAFYKLPEDVTTEQADSLFKEGFNKASASSVAKVLNGAWYFSSDRNGWTSMVVRYADFTTGDVQKAIQSAIEHEGFSSDSITNSGVDDSGNTFTAGTAEADGVGCTWRVSALPLDDMYSTRGLPDNATYVGIRVTLNE